MARTTCCLFILFCSLPLPFSAEGENTATSRPYWQKALSWYEAYRQCHQARVALPVPMATDFSDLDPWLPRDGSRVWVGGRYVHTSWKWTDNQCEAMNGAGCVTLSQLSPFIRRRRSSVQSPVDCLSVCQSAHVAMQGTECLCLTSRPPTGVDQSHCSLRCLDNFDQSCGGIQYYSLHSWHPGSMAWDSDVTEVQGECAYIYLPIIQSASGRKLRLRSSGCNPTLGGEFKPFLCEHCSPSKETCDVSRQAAYKTWSQARHDCQAQGAQLLHPRHNESLPLMYHAHTSESYWVGLKRDFLLRWINGSKADIRSFSKVIGRKDGRCLAASRGDHAGVQLTAVNCALELPFVCDPAPPAGTVTFTSPTDPPPSCLSESSTTPSSPSTVTTSTTATAGPPELTTDVPSTSTQTSTSASTVTSSSTDDAVTRTLFPDASSTEHGGVQTTSRGSTGVHHVSFVTSSPVDTTAFAHRSEPKSSTKESWTATIASASMKSSSNSPGRTGTDTDPLGKSHSTSTLSFVTADTSTRSSLPSVTTDTSTRSSLPSVTIHTSTRSGLPSVTAHISTRSSLPSVTARTSTGSGLPDEDSTRPYPSQHTPTGSQRPDQRQSTAALRSQSTPAGRGTTSSLPTTRPQAPQQPSTSGQTTFPSSPTPDRTLPTASDRTRPRPTSTPAPPTSSGMAEVTSGSATRRSSGQVTRHLTSMSSQVTLLPTPGDRETPADLTPLYVTVGVLSGVIVLVALLLVCLCLCRSQRFPLTGQVHWSETVTPGDTMPSRSVNTLRTRLASRLRSEHTISMEPLFRFVEHQDH